MDAPLRVGLVGAGPWAKAVHAPGLADHPGTALTTVWARRPAAAHELAEAHGASVSRSLDELIEQVDAVAFAVPPAVQTELALPAVQAGKHVILEKPLAADIASAERLADAVLAAEVASLVMFTLRFAAETREWLDDLAAVGGWVGGSARWLSGALLGGTYSGSAWRHEAGALADIGPHVIDLLDAALGPITGVVTSYRSEADLRHLVFTHEGGASSTATMSMRLPIQPTVAEIAVYGAHGYRSLSRRPVAGIERFTALLDDFAAMVATGTTVHPCDVRRGLHVQRVLEQAKRATRTRFTSP
ncbi:Gfo/Idh/MocA family protein [Amycolatopsis pithecellobii]|uniref:Gfo/Idh/MocA family oxidoreductase n=1 Tax=Amycolatopsis pithecellobii TaxID=664692 RepID=A0A6N7Z8S3_9PSEU|nr:Gfo/Idh/MocA family oxidoreductase [Amycolatopsis pithecellobii]MTD58070.1 gfo/Idh/MocA family oxidoreductase [Amycolatopsis pithecellobii]